MNFNAIKKHVSTQYGDLTGVVQIDGHDSTLSLRQMCKDHHIEMDGKFILGFSLSEHTIQGIGRGKEVNVKILFLHKEDYGDNYDEIESNISKEDSIKVYAETFYIKYNELRKYIKRYEFLAVSKLFDSIKELEILESI